MRTPKVFAALVGLLSLTANAHGAGVKLIANPSLNIDVVSVNELKSVFLEERSSLGDGTRVVPVLEKGGATHAAFLQQYLDESDEELQLHYRTLVFTGKGAMPKAVSSDAEVIAYVRKTNHAIGYVDADMPVRGVKTLIVMRAPKGAERALVSRVEPTYPQTLRDHAIGGIVRVQVNISAKGNVGNINLLGGNPILAQAATEAVQQWKYAAGHTDTTMEISIPFDPQQ